MYYVVVFFFQAEDGIRDLVRSRGLGDVYKRQERGPRLLELREEIARADDGARDEVREEGDEEQVACLLYTSDAADERSSVDLGGRRIIKQKNR